LTRTKGSKLRQKNTIFTVVDSLSLHVVPFPKNIFIAFYRHLVQNRQTIHRVYSLPRVLNRLGTRPCISKAATRDANEIMQKKRLAVRNSTHNISTVWSCAVWVKLLELLYRMVQKKLKHYRRLTCILLNLAT